jgi:nucleotide-binding universal stress UspA family protein
MRAHRILCPVDFSDPSRRALHYAAAVAAREGAALHVLYVLPPAMPLAVPILMVAIRSAAVDVRTAAVESLQAFIARAALPQPPIAIVRDGPPADAILACAADIAADLIVLGSHGRDGLGHLLFGSTAERVLHKAPCPTLIVPVHAGEPASVDDVRFTRILCGLDFSPASLRALGLALSTAQDHGAELTVLHVVGAVAEDELEDGLPPTVRAHIDELTHTARERLHAAVPPAAHAGCTIREVVRYGRASHAIPLEAGEHGVDLIVVGAHGHRGLGLLGIGSTTHAVVCRATCPVLTTRP